MAWISVPGLTGRVYLPDGADQIGKKHPCDTCFSCQWCDENRCRVCRGDHAEAGKPGPSPCSRRRHATPAKMNRA